MKILTLSAEKNLGFGQSPT